MSCSKTSTFVEENKAGILVFYKTKGFYHDCIPAALAALQQLGKENNLAVDTTANADVFTDATLSRYNAVVFLCTTGDVLSKQEEEVFERFIKKGGGFMGVHSATDTEYDWQWYNNLVGAQFLSHPHIQNATIRIADANHAATKMLPTNWERRDEWYNFKNIQPQIKVLAFLDETTYAGGIHGTNHPIAWYHYFDGGRAFYTAGGHTSESYSEPLFLEHLLGGIQFVAGK